MGMSSQGRISGNPPTQAAFTSGSHSVVSVGVVGFTAAHVGIFLFFTFRAIIQINIKKPVIFEGKHRGIVT